MKLCAPALHNPASPEFPAPPPCTSPLVPRTVAPVYWALSPGLSFETWHWRWGRARGGNRPPGAAVTLPGPREERAGQAGLHCCSLTGRCSHHTLQLPARRGHSIHHRGRGLLAGRSPAVLF